MYLTNGIISMLLFIVFFLFIMLGAQDDILQTISTFNTHNLVWLGIIGYFYWQNLKLERQIKGKKTSFENLRLEVIEHLKTADTLTNRQRLEMQFLTNWNSMVLI